MNRAIAGVFLLFFAGACLSAHAQQHFSDTLQPKSDSAAAITRTIKVFTDSVYAVYNQKKYTGAKVQMPSLYFDKFMDKYFSYVTTSKAGLPDGNSVSLQPARTQRPSRRICSTRIGIPSLMAVCRQITRITSPTCFPAMTLPAIPAFTRTSAC
jgi:hypothetical protein